MEDVELKITETNKPVKGYTKTWYFLDYKDPARQGFRVRWVIAYMEESNWWGVVANFPATHENALDMIPREIKIAKEAIKLLKLN